MLYPALFKLLFGSLEWVRMRHEKQPEHIKVHAMYIASSIQDPLVGKQPELIYTLKKARIPFIYKEYGHGNRLAMHNFQLPLKLGRQCMEDELTFFKHQA